MVATNRNLDQARAEALQFYDDADPRWFEYLADDAVVYAINQTEPTRGRLAYEQRFMPFLIRNKRSSDVLSSDEQLLGGSAVISQTLRITESGIMSTVRQSVIWADDDGWKIKHLHSALVGTPAGTAVPRTAGAITVLNERIATMAAVLGVAQ